MTTRKQDRVNRRANRKSERQEKRATKRGKPQAETYYGGTINPAVVSAGMGADWEKKVKMRQHIRKGQDKAARAIYEAASWAPISGAAAVGPAVRITPLGAKAGKAVTTGAKAGKAVTTGAKAGKAVTTGAKAGKAVTTGAKTAATTGAKTATTGTKAATTGARTEGKAVATTAGNGGAKPPTNGSSVTTSTPEPPKPNKSSTTSASATPAKPTTTSTPVPPKKGKYGQEIKMTDWRKAGAKRAGETDTQYYKRIQQQADSRWQKNHPKKVYDSPASSDAEKLKATRRVRNRRVEAGAATGSGAAAATGYYFATKKDRKNKKADKYAIKNVHAYGGKLRTCKTRKK